MTTEIRWSGLVNGQNVQTPDGIAAVVSYRHSHEFGGQTVDMIGVRSADGQPLTVNGRTVRNVSYRADAVAAATFGTVETASAVCADERRPVALNGVELDADADAVAIAAAVADAIAAAGETIDADADADAADAALIAAADADYVPLNG